MAVSQQDYLRSIGIVTDSNYIGSSNTGSSDIGIIQEGGLNNPPPIPVGSSDIGVLEKQSKRFGGNDTSVPIGQIKDNKIRTLSAGVTLNNNMLLWLQDNWIIALVGVGAIVLAYSFRT